MKVIGVIPARFKSSRFPGKPLVDILGKPMVQRVYERALRSRLLDGVFVATDDESIRLACSRRGIQVIMTSPDHPTGTDRMSEVAQKLKGDVFVNIQGDEPLISPISIDAAIRGLLRSPARTVSCLMKKITDPAELINVNVPKVVVNGNKEAVFFSRLPVPFPKGQGTAIYHKQVCVYGFSRATLLRFSRLPQGRNERAEEIELLRLIEQRIPIQMVEVFAESLAVDVPSDVGRVCQVLASGRKPHLRGS